MLLFNKKILKIQKYITSLQPIYLLRTDHLLLLPWG